ncbi:putative GATA transcription factor 22 [Dendrobium catenatum]|uniref:GATA transcription factor 22 n=1 Tax=Dendrobium catenatum TaxID=906689 RepID=A0A2I0WPM0_9ASPA|nr:putative GATA transcription factor 22 [Dendrobium catenatum]PKU77610.1 Putative GATA transcription factor 22 [Dendrobium catenatum]
MTPFYNCQIPQFPLENENQRQSHIPFLSLATSTSSTSPYPFFLHNQQDHIALDHGVLPHHQAHLQEEYIKEVDQQQGPVKWMSSKMRIMRKMLNSNQTPKIKTRRNNHQHQDQKQAAQDNIIRVCSDCSTTKTPLWRSGPHGPKSLCNACGIRQRKARRAMAASAMSSGAVLKDGKDKASDFVDRTVPFKKRCRFATEGCVTTQRKLCFEDIVVSLNKSSANFHRVFPQDEKDAAILLMALSCGLL